MIVKLQAHYQQGTVFQTALFSLVIIPRLRPGLLSLRSVLSSRQQNNKTTKQQNNQTTKQQNNQTTILYKRYGNANAKSYTIEPYCIKLHKQRWYVLGHFHYTEAELNPAEILWCVLKCKWFRPVDYNNYGLSLLRHRQCFGCCWQHLKSKLLIISR